MFIFISQLWLSRAELKIGILKFLARTLEASCYKYFFNGKKAQSKNILSKVTLLKNADKKGLTTFSKALKIGHVIGVGMNTSRELANTPANICTPTFLASQAKKLSKLSTLKIKIKKLN